MKRKLVVYFSASGNTAKLAENLADAIGADAFSESSSPKLCKKAVGEHLF